MKNRKWLKKKNWFEKTIANTNIKLEKEPKSKQMNLTTIMTKYWLKNWISSQLST